MSEDDAILNGRANRTNRFRRSLWKAAINTSIPQNQKLKNGVNPELKSVNMVNYLMKLFRGDENQRYDYYQSKGNLDMPSCVPKCTRYPDARCWVTYTGFPLFLTITSIAQVSLSDRSLYNLLYTFKSHFIKTED